MTLVLHQKGLSLPYNDHYSMSKINYWRTTNQTEIDFIITAESGTTAIEVKWNKKTIPKSFKTIKK
jgi:predicted AAA+ superfamily ATPase